MDLQPQRLGEVVVGDARLAHPLLQHHALPDQRNARALHGRADPVHAQRERCEQPMHDGLMMEPTMLPR